MTPAIEELIRQIEAAGDVFEWYGPQPESTIAEVEAALGVIFPPSFRAFLGRYGGGVSGRWAGSPASGRESLSGSTLAVCTATRFAFAATAGHRRISSW